ncbi:hypothetical protein ACLKA6_016668 [Drosophila palustris]
MLGQSYGIVVHFLLSFILVKCEIYSSVDKLVELEHVEKELVIGTRHFLKEQQQELNEYRSFVARVKREHEVAQHLGDEYWEQPLNAFRLTKRLVEDWSNLHDQLEDNPQKNNYELLVNSISKELGYPTLDDLRGSARGLVRLQKIYNISASEFADGNLNGVFTDAVFVWRDCYEIGVQLYEQADYSSALEWLVLAANMLNEMDSEGAQQFVAEVYEYLALTYIELGEKQLALEMLSDVLSVDPTHPAQHTLNYLEHRSDKCPEILEEEIWWRNYTLLCRGERLPEKISSKSSLRCYQDSKRHGIFQLAPLKVEQVHRNPDINIYHQVINDRQIDSILEVSSEIEKIRSSTSGGRQSDVRVSQQVWVNYSSPIMSSLSQLVSAITNLDMGNAEIMQVADYSVGGQYTSHFDYISRMPNDYKGKGNRLFTVMFYLSDVLQGGYTVFTKLNLFLKPIKGSMVVWNNQLRSLQRDDRTAHAGCPVLEGSKRIGNVWIHSSLQEFRLPCTLNSNE